MKHFQNSFPLILILFTLLPPISGEGIRYIQTEKCDKDTDCFHYNFCENQICVHKEIFPLGLYEWLGTVILMFIAIISNAGGVGGSVISTSLLLGLFYFSPHNAVALTQSFIFAGTSVSVLLKIRDRHPTRNRPLIYYDVLMQLCSPLLLGVSIGVMISPAFPDWLILAILTLVVLFLAINSFFKARRLHQNETRAKMFEKVKKHMDNEMKEEGVKRNADEGNRFTVEEQKLEGNDLNSNANMLNGVRREDEGEEEEDRVIDEGNEDERISESTERVSDEVAKEISDKKEMMRRDKLIRESDDISKCRRYKDLPIELKAKILEIHRTEGKVISMFHIIYFVLLALFSILFTLLRGSNTSKSIAGVNNCSGSFTIVVIGYILSMLLLSVYSSIYLVRKTNICEKANYDFEEGDIHWHAKKCFLFVVIGLVTGFMVGILGLGAGYIFGPILLYINIRPEISTISSSFTIAISAFTAMVQFSIEGLIDWKYASWLMVTSATGALIGILFLRKYAIKIGRASLLIFCLCIILVISFIIIPTVGIINITNQVDKGMFTLGFTDICV